MMQQTI